MPAAWSAASGPTGTCSISLKPYPCCRWIHSTLDAVRELVARHAVSPDSVRRVTVRSIEAFPLWFHGRRPPTMVDAEFSVPHAVAMVLLDGLGPTGGRRPTGRIPPSSS